MADFCYRAYISYSHKDEVMAAWLHRGLESYRVPRVLVGQQTGAGEIPARIQPVFRDREDLSSSADLEGTVREALAESESLIVLCSPEAAASHWVNEEIREFARLGRADRIFCIIVAGDLASDGSVSNCLPPALAEIGLQEPLAADVRDWADGKRVAKLKLIAGLLGIRLDELLHRDLKRRHRHQLLVAFGVVAALTLTITTILSQISEQQEREKTEQFATFIVDLGERLQTDVDLETRALIGKQTTAYFENLNPDKLTAETGQKVAIAVRQMGLVSEGLGRPDEALESFRQSRDLLSTLVRKYPELPELLFQLGYAEFYIGNLQLGQGNVDEAHASMQRNFQINQSLLEIDPDNTDWLMELAYAHNNLAALRLDGGKGINNETIKHVQEATRLMEKVALLRPGDQAVADGYATILAWAADAQYQACNLGEVELLRGRSVELARSATGADPGNNDLRLQYAYAISGAARMQIITGQTDLAAQNLQESISILQHLSAVDLNNVFYRNEEVYARSLFAALLGETGQLDAAQSIMQKLATEFESTGGLTSETERSQHEFITFQLTYADVENRLGNINKAQSLLSSAIRLLRAHSDLQAQDMHEAALQIEAKYQWWVLHGESHPDFATAMPGIFHESNNEFRSCIEANSAARFYFVEGETVNAAHEADYLTLKGYAAPAFIRFCTEHNLCEK